VNGVGVIVSVGRGVDVTVNVGIGVNVRVGRGVNVSVGGTLVDGSAGMGEGEAVCVPSLKLQARMVRINKMRRYDFLFFTFSLY
jgi:hypothetical protein